MTRLALHFFPNAKQVLSVLGRLVKWRFGSEKQSRLEMENANFLFLGLVCGEQTCICKRDSVGNAIYVSDAHFLELRKFEQRVDDQDFLIPQITPVVSIAISVRTSFPACLV